jgi:OOP family OmpA-OmpF porin
MRHSTELALQHPGPRTAPFACHLAVLGLLALTAPVSAQETAPAQDASPIIKPSDPLVPNVSYSPGQYAKIEGTIVSRKGDALLVRRQNSQEMSVVTLTERTEIESPAGIMNLERKKQDMAKLQPGLFLKVRGHGGDQKELVAERISFHKGALKVTNQISSGTVELKEEMDARFEANADSINAAKARARTELSSLATRIADLDAYDAKFTGSVQFATGSAELSSAARSTLDSLVELGTGLNGVLVEIAGFADSRGSVEANRRLSQRRVESVVAYLAGTHHVPLRKIVNPSGLGTSQPIGSNNTAEGRAMNRRVEVKILVNRGMNETGRSTPAPESSKFTPERPMPAPEGITPVPDSRTPPPESVTPVPERMPSTPDRIKSDADRAKSTTDSIKSAPQRAKPY